MKILLVGRASPELNGKSVGGIATHMCDLATHLTKNKHEVILLDYTLFRDFDKNGIRVRGIGWSERLVSLIQFVVFTYMYVRIIPYYSFKDLVKLAIQFRLAKSLSKWADVIHVHSLHEPISGFFEKEERRKLVITDHGFWQNSSTFSNKGRNKLFHHIACSSKLLYISDFAFKKWESLGLINDAREKMLKFPNPLRDTGFFELNKPRDTIFFNGLSESMTRKRLPTFLEAIKDPYFDNFRIVCIVDDDGRHYIGKKYNKSSNLLAYSKLTLKKVEEIYQKSLVMVLPSKSESFGLVYLEALINGCPIIGFEETFEEFKSVLKTNIGLPISPTEDSDILNSKIKYILGEEYNPTILHEEVIKNYGWGNRINELIQVYSSVLNV